MKTIESITIKGERILLLIPFNGSRKGGNAG